MSTPIWFKAKRYGWGWYPVSWQGWLIILLYLSILVPLTLRLDAEQHSVSDFLMNFSIPFVVLTSMLLAVCYKKGERPHWSWGSKKQDN